MKRELFERYKGNPILTPDMWPYAVARVFNTAATIFNGQTVLLARVEDLIGFSHLTLAKSENGETDWNIGNKPTLQAESAYGEHFSGLEDPRITYFGDSKQYIISCVYFRGDFLKNPHGINLIGTSDFLTFYRISKPLQPLDKNAALFPEKIKDKFALIHRPLIDGQTCIAVSFSPDLIHWGGVRQILSPIPGTWCGFRVGLGAQPIKTQYGWLIIFHGSKDIASKTVYCVGLALLDLKTLDVTHRTKERVIAPIMDYEGGPAGIIFPCGAVVKDGNLNMYYGANDYSIGLATAKLSEVLDYLTKCPVS